MRVNEEDTFRLLNLMEALFTLPIATPVLKYTSVDATVIYK